MAVHVFNPVFYIDMHALYGIKESWAPAVSASASLRLCSIFTAVSAAVWRSIFWSTRNADAVSPTQMQHSVPYTLPDPETMRLD